MVNEKADSLRVDCLKTVPRMFFWSEVEGWEVVHPFEENDFSEDDRENEKKTGYCDFETMELSNWPMMNYIYDLPNRDNFEMEDAKKIKDLPLCLMYFYEDEGTEEHYALALTGGGMDLSWQICEAYMRLGYYPPVHFRLPNMAGKENSDRNLGIVEACIEGRKIVQRWMSNDILDLEHVRESLRR